MTLHACSAVNRHGLLFYFSLVSVNVFILISGYFKIKLKWKSFLNFIFLVTFWTCINAIWVIYENPTIGDKELMLRMNPFKNWFISSYLLLMLLSPILNGFWTSTKNRGRFLLMWFCVEFLVDFIIPLKIWGVFGGGYTVFHFIGLYLLGALIHDKNEKLNFLKRKNWLLMYIGITLISFIIFKILEAVSSYQGFISLCARGLIQRLEFYSSPLVLVASVTLFVFFSEIRIQSLLVNHIAQSMFAVFLAHCPGYYRQTIQCIGANHTGIAEFIMITGFVLAVFMGAVIVDQFRLIIWKGICLICTKIYRTMA